MKLTDRLLEINVEIPEATPALGSYVPYKIINNFLLKKMNFLQFKCL